MFCRDPIGRYQVAIHNIFVRNLRLRSNIGSVCEDDDDDDDDDDDGDTTRVVG